MRIEIKLIRGKGSERTFSFPKTNYSHRKVIKELEQLEKEMYAQNYQKVKNEI